MRKLTSAYIFKTWATEYSFKIRNSGKFSIPTASTYYYDIK